MIPEDSKSPMSSTSDRRRAAWRLAAAVLVTLLVPGEAWCCDGLAGRSIAVNFDGVKFTVTNIGTQVVSVTFTTAYNTYDLLLTPGQSAQPQQPGIFGQFMSGYQSCVATPLPSR